MKLVKRPFFWLALSVVALLVSAAGMDLRLISAALCGVAVLTAAKMASGQSVDTP
jgi:hypothetical protein